MAGVPSAWSVPSGLFALLLLLAAAPRAVHADEGPLGEAEAFMVICPRAGGQPVAACEAEQRAFADDYARALAGDRPSGARVAARLRDGGGGVARNPVQACAWRLALALALAGAPGAGSASAEAVAEECARLTPEAWDRARARARDIAAQPPSRPGLMSGPGEGWPGLTARAAWPS